MYTVRVWLKGGRMPKFNLMSYIMPPEDKMFFTLFQNSAELCTETAQLYLEIIESGFTDDRKEMVLKAKKKGSLSLKLTLKQLNKSFITPLEREDIQYIAVNLYKINKKIGKACLNLDVYKLKKCTKEMKEQASILIKAVCKLNEIIKCLKKVSDVELITKLNIEMKELETYGDGVHRKAISDLFSGKYEALEVIKLRDIYKDIENSLDTCYHISDTILNVALKQS